MFLDVLVIFTASYVLINGYRDSLRVLDLSRILSQEIQDTAFYTRQMQFLALNNGNTQM